MLHNISTRIGWRFTLFFLALNFCLQGTAAPQFEKSVE